MSTVLSGSDVAAGMGERPSAHRSYLGNPQHTGNGHVITRLSHNVEATHCLVVRGKCVSFISCGNGSTFHFSETSVFQREL